MFYKFINKKIIIFILWVDNCCISGKKDAVLQAVKDFTSLWDCKDLGELKEYVGCKVDRTERIIQFTKQVKIQRFIDEFNCQETDGGNKLLTTPAPPGTVLEYDKELEEPLLSKKQTQFRFAWEYSCICVATQGLIPSTESGKCPDSCRRRVEKAIKP